MRNKGLYFVPLFLFSHIDLFLYFIIMLFFELVIEHNNLVEMLLNYVLWLIRKKKGIYYEVNGP